MKRNPFVIPVALGLFLCGCAATAPQTQYRTFSFEHEGNDYLIVNMGNPTLENSNILLSRDGDNIVLKAKDFDRDGTLDTLEAGAISLEQANVIYGSGIEQAATELKLESRLPTSTFLVSTNDGYYTVESFTPGEYQFVVRLIVFMPAEQETSVFLDENADGHLDRRQRGDLSTTEAQSAYRTVLQRGVAEGRIEHTSGRYVVVPEGGRGPGV